MPISAAIQHPEAALPLLWRPLSGEQRLPAEQTTRGAVDAIDLISASPILSGIIATAIGGGLLEILRRRYKQNLRARDWYGKSLGQLSNLQQAARKATAYRNGVNHSTLEQELSPLDREIMMHANEAPRRVEEAAQVELAVIAAYATGLSSLAEKSAEMDSLEFVQRVQTDAIKNYDGGYDIQDLEQLFSSFDLDEFANELDTDVAVNDEKADELLSRFSEDSLEAGRPTSVEEALSIPVKEAKDVFEGEGYLETAVDNSLELFVNMVTELAKETHERMEIRQNRV